MSPKPLRALLVLLNLFLLASKAYYYAALKSAPTWLTPMSPRNNNNNNNNNDNTVDCAVLFRNDRQARETARNWKPNFKKTEIRLLSAIFEQNCSLLHQIYQFPSEAASSSEAAFPLAFILIVNSRPWQIMNLFELIFWPQNLYCVTYDEKSSETIKQLVSVSRIVRLDL